MDSVTNINTNIPERGQLADVDVYTFIFAGCAIFTIYNPRTDGSLTYRIEKSEGNDRFAPTYFVSLLTGPDNREDYTYLGIIPVGGVAVDKPRFRLTRASKLGEDSRPVKALRWLLARAAIRDLGPVEVYHEGRCGRCGRRLTTVESCQRGIGPVCFDKVA